MPSTLVQTSHSAALSSVLVYILWWIWNFYFTKPNWSRISGKIWYRFKRGHEDLKEQFGK